MGHNIRRTLSHFRSIGNNNRLQDCHQVLVYKHWDWFTNIEIAIDLEIGSNNVTFSLTFTLTCHFKTHLILTGIEITLASHRIRIIYAFNTDL